MIIKSPFKIGDKIWFDISKSDGVCDKCGNDLYKRRAVCGTIVKILTSSSQCGGEIDTEIYFCTAEYGDIALHRAFATEEEAQEYMGATRFAPSVSHFHVDKSRDHKRFSELKSLDKALRKEYLKKVMDKALRKEQVEKTPKKPRKENK